MHRPIWTLRFEPHPTPDGHERLVRALRLLLERPEQPQRLASPPRAVLALADRAQGTDPQRKEGRQ
jgi:hypothetical protein